MLNFAIGNARYKYTKILIPILVGVLVGLLSTNPFILLSIVVVLAVLLLYIKLANNPDKLLYFMVLVLPLNTLINIVIYNFLGIDGTKLTLIQAYKDLLLIIVLATRFFNLKKDMFIIQKRNQPIILAGLCYFIFEIIYLIFPIGPATFNQKFYALRTDTWYVLFFFMGILIPKINYKKIMKLVLALSIVFTLVAIVEKIINPIPFLVWLGYPKYVIYQYGASPLTNSGLPYTYWASGGIRRMGSLLLNPLDYSAFILFSFPTMLIIKRNKIRLLITILQIVGVVLSISRTATILLIVEILILLFWSYPNLRKLLTGLGTLFGTVVLFIILMEDKFKNYILNTITFQESSAKGHLDQWTIAITKIIENPFGLGLSTAGSAGAKANLLYGGENQYLIMAVQLGFLGLLVFLTFLFCTLITVSRLPFENERKWLFIVILILIISGFTQQSFLNITLTFISFTLIGNMIRETKEKINVKTT